VTALQAQSPKIKLQSHQKTKKENDQVVQLNMCTLLYVVCTSINLFLNKINYPLYSALFPIEILKSGYLLVIASMRHEALSLNLSYVKKKKLIIFFFF
jgi:hypothetical protein